MSLEDEWPIEEIRAFRKLIPDRANRAKFRHALRALYQEESGAMLGAIMAQLVAPVAPCAESPSSQDRATIAPRIAPKPPPLYRGGGGFGNPKVAQ